MAEKTKLQGRFGKIWSFDLSTVIVGDGTTDLPVGEYIVKTVAASSTLPFPVGYTFTVLDTDTITPAVGDDVYDISTGKIARCDISSFTATTSAAELDGTTLCDAHDNGFNVYEKGLSDISGTFDGIFRADLTDEDGGVVNKFFTIAEQAADGTGTIKPVDESKLYLQIYLNTASKQGESVSGYIMPVQLFTNDISLTPADLQTFSASFRPTSDETVKVHYFKRLQA